MPVVAFVFSVAFLLRLLAFSVSSVEVSPSAPAVALVGIGPLPSSIVASVLGVVATVGGSVACVVGAEVGGSVGAEVSMGLEFLQPQPVNRTTVNTAANRRTPYFFIFRPPNNMVSDVLLPDLNNLPW